MTTLVLSVPHTGTRFVMRTLLDAFRDPEVVNWHINDNILELEAELRSFDRILVPMRNPWETARSWKRRGKLEIPGLVKRLDILAEYVSQFAVWWIPIDTDDRDAHIGCINAALGLNLDPGTWAPVGTWKADQKKLIERGEDEYPDLTLTDEERDLVRDCLERNAEFFGRFYDEIH